MSFHAEGAQMRCPARGSPQEGCTGLLSIFVKLFALCGGETVLFGAGSESILDPPPCP